MKPIELFDETLDINSTENYELGLQAGPDGFSFCLLDTLRNKFVLMRAYEPDENKYYNSHIIREFIEKDDFLTRRYKKTRIIIPSSRFTVVPAPLFDPAKKDDFFSFNHRHDAGEIIRANRVTDPEIFIVYSFPVSIYDVITELYPDANPVVHVVPLLTHISKERRSSHHNYIHVHIERDCFNLIIFYNNDLKFFNTFKYRNVSDIIYYILNVFNKLDIKQEETLHISGLAEKNKDLASGITAYIRGLKFAEPWGNFNFSYVFNDIELHRYLNLFSVFNCG